MAIPTELPSPHFYCKWVCKFRCFGDLHSLIIDNYRLRYCLRVLGRYVDSLFVRRRRSFFAIISRSVRRTEKLYWALKCELFVDLFLFRYISTDFACVHAEKTLCPLFLSELSHFFVRIAIFIRIKSRFFVRYKSKFCVRIKSKTFVRIKSKFGYVENFGYTPPPRSNLK